MRVPRLEVHVRLTFDQQIHGCVGGHEHVPQRFRMVVQRAGGVRLNLHLDDARLRRIDNARDLDWTARRFALGEDEYTAGDRTRDR